MDNISKLIDSEKKLFINPQESHEISRKREIACDLKELIARVWQLMRSAMHEEARVRSDKILRQESETVDYKNLVLLYLNLMQVLSAFKNDEVFSHLWASFIDEFNETMLKDTKAPLLFSHLPARALNEIFDTWQEDPVLANAIDDSVGEKQGKAVSKLLPKYLLTRMVGETWIYQLESLSQGACELIVLESFGEKKRLSHLAGRTRFAYVLAKEGLFFIDREECEAKQIQRLTVDVNKIKEIKTFFKVNNVSDDGFINLDQGPVQHVSKVIFALMPNQLPVFEKILGHDNKFITTAYEALFNGVRQKLQFLLPKWKQAKQLENILQNKSVIGKINSILRDKLACYQSTLKNVDQQIMQYVDNLQYETLRSMIAGLRQITAVVPSVNTYAERKPWHAKQWRDHHERLRILYNLYEVRKKENGSEVDDQLLMLQKDIEQHKSKLIQIGQEIDQSYQKVYGSILQFHNDIERLLQDHPDIIYWAKGLMADEKDKLLSKEKAYALLSDCSPVVLRFLEEEITLPFTKLQPIAQLTLMQHQLQQGNVIDVIRELSMELINLFDKEKIDLPGVTGQCSLATVFREMQYRFSSHIEQIGKKIVDGCVHAEDGAAHPLFQCLIVSDHFRGLIGDLADLTGMDKKCVNEANIAAAKIPDNLTVAKIDGERESYQWNIFTATGAFIYHAATAVVRRTFSTVTGTAQCAAIVATTAGSWMYWGAAASASLATYPLATAFRTFSRPALRCAVKVASKGPAEEDNSNLLTN